MGKVTRPLTEPANVISGMRDCVISGYQCLVRKKEVVKRKQMLMRGKDGYKCVSSLAGFFKRPAPINLDPCQPPLSSGIYSKEAAFHDLLIRNPLEGLRPDCKL